MFDLKFSSWCNTQVFKQIKFQFWFQNDCAKFIEEWAPEWCDIISRTYALISASTVVPGLRYNLISEIVIMPEVCVIGSYSNQKDENAETET